MSKVPFSIIESEIIPSSNLYTKFVFLKEVDSTNTFLIKNQSPPGTIVVADTQLRGKGRNMRKWFSPPGKNLYFSILFPNNNLSSTNLLQLNIVMAVAIAESLRENFSVPAMIKWPNDVFIDEKKTGGILIEAELSGDKLKKIVAGAGINVNLAAEELPGELKTTATSLFITTGKLFRREEVLKSILKMLDLWYNIFVHEGFSPVKRKVEEYFLWKEMEVKVIDGTNSLEGTAKGIDEKGFLIIEKDGKKIKIMVGDVSLRREDASHN